MYKTNSMHTKKKLRKLGKFSIACWAKKYSQKQPISLLQEGKVISNNVDVANAFNNYFSNIPNHHDL